MSEHAHAHTHTLRGRNRLRENFHHTLACTNLPCIELLRPRWLTADARGKVAA